MKIIQIVIGPDNSSYQGVLLGLGDDNTVYEAHNGPLGNTWKPFFQPCPHCEGKGTFKAWNHNKGNFIETCDCPAGKALPTPPAKSMEVKL